MMKFFVLGLLMAAPVRAAVSITISAPADGVTESSAAFVQAFETVAKAGGGVITVPPGDFYFDGKTTIPLPSNTTVLAHGARFVLPKVLGDKARITLFAGTNVQHLTWMGGEFVGYCFDHKRMPNTWEPNVTTRMIVIETTAEGEGGTTDVTFRDVKSDRVAGAVISVFGALKKGSEREVERHATNVTLDNCTLIDSGRFMWDYGLLWQIMTWPEDYTPEMVAMATKYFRNDLVREGLTFDGEVVKFDNTVRPIAVSATNEPKELITFLGDGLPKNLVKGKGYWVVETAPDHIKISDSVGGAPIKCEPTTGGAPKLAFNLLGTYYGLYSPTGTGTGKGCFDLVGCKAVRVTGCKISALGDTMHIQRSEDIVFANNHILGSRMGAFFLAEFCKNATITGNIVDGGNGSRVISVEKSCEDVTMTGNTFRNGGRGAWINQPRHFVMTGNVFINNTTKGEADPWRGRRSHQAGDYLKYPELYFTQYEPDGQYGDIIVSDNVFTTGPGASEAITFARGGTGIQLDGNVFLGEKRTVVVEQGVKEIQLGRNPGAKIRKVKAGEQSLLYHGRPE
jgi:hypothetical protein